jgi:hypothetical protein
MCLAYHCPDRPICILHSGRAGGESLRRLASERLQKSADLPIRLPSSAHFFRPRPIAPTPGSGRNESAAPGRKEERQSYRVFSLTRAPDAHKAEKSRA